MTADCAVKVYEMWKTCAIYKVLMAFYLYLGWPESSTVNGRTNYKRLISVF